MAYSFSIIGRETGLQGVYLQLLAGHSYRTVLLLFLDTLLTLRAIETRWFKICEVTRKNQWVSFLQVLCALSTLVIVIFMIAISSADSVRCGFLQVLREGWSVCPSRSPLRRLRRLPLRRRWDGVRWAVNHISVIAITDIFCIITYGR